MRKSDLLAAIQKEIHLHDFGTFVENPPTIAQGGASLSPAVPRARKGSIR
jgi:hypothetical protein